ncbi:MAG: SEC-C domain-containing protein [Desulfovibrio sp.]|jgi:SEC-C motif-containing protein|nr:SEC-C domain-containing protein [Desulfovibrio sp.]
MSGDLCPCGSGKEEKVCCGPIVEGEAPARTPEELMRARYCAHCRRSYAFLVESIHPAHRRGVTEAGIAEWARHVQWTGLQILAAAPGESEDEGQVSFAANYTISGIPRTMREDAAFRREEGKWFYVDGKVYGPEPFQHTTPKAGRNDSCPCGSGKKYKKCCGR